MTIIGAFIELETHHMTIIGAFIAGNLTTIIAISLLRRQYQRRMEQRIDIAKHAAFVKAMTR
jgi:hypothetical protein